MGLMDRVDAGAVSLGACRQLDPGRRRGPMELVPLDLVRTLCEMLARDGITYCHWKSNWALDRSASGENDLDLLVSLRDAQRFTELLLRLGFKQARVPDTRRFPGVFHYYGFDSASGRLVHVHAHHHLVLGDDMTKNYRLPVEDEYLESAIQGILFKVPAPEFEFIVFVIRMVLKHDTWDAGLTSRSRLSLNERRELDDLVGLVDPERARLTLRRHLPMIDDDLFRRCVDSLQPGATPWFRMIVAHRLQQSLAAHGTYPEIADVMLRLSRRSYRRLRRSAFGRRTQNTLDRGCLIAVVGGDGAGKTSAVDELHQWMSTTFRTARVHLGKPPRSTTTLVVRGCLRVGRLFGLVPDTQAATTARTGPEGFPGYPWLLSQVLTARDRHRTYVRARRLAAKGEIVISDRYPLPEIRLMDHPRSTSFLPSAHLNAVTKHLIDRERRYYQQILKPDLLIVLKVEPEIALGRKLDEKPGTLRARSAEIWNYEWRDGTACVIDANRSKDEVLGEIKSSVWSIL